MLRSAAGASPATTLPHGLNFQEFEEGTACLDLDITPHTNNSPPASCSNLYERQRRRGFMRLSPRTTFTRGVNARRNRGMPGHGWEPHYRRHVFRSASSPRRATGTTQRSSLRRPLPWGSCFLAAFGLHLAAARRSTKPSQVPTGRRRPNAMSDCENASPSRGVCLLVFLCCFGFVFCFCWL